MSKLAADRYALLIAQLGAELGHGRGWKAEVARRLGVSPSYVSRIDRGDREGIGKIVIDRARERLGVDEEWFSAPEVHHYTEHLRQRVIPQWRELTGIPTWQDGLTPEVRAKMRQIEMRNSATQLLELLDMRPTNQAIREGIEVLARKLASDVLEELERR